MAKTASGFNTFNMRIDKDLLVFLKQTAIKQDCSMTSLVSRLLNDYRKRIEKKSNVNDDNEKDYLNN